MDFSNPTDEIAAVAHRCWCKRMLKQGWRIGTVLDPVARTHDALRPYRDLAPEDRGRLRLAVSWDGCEEDLADSVGNALEKPELSTRDIRIGTRVRMVGGDPDDIGTIVSMLPVESEPDVLGKIAVQWPNGEVAEYAPSEDAIETVNG